MAWQPDGSFYVADGYANTRVVKFDKDGKYLKAWGEQRRQRATGAKLETRPNYFNNVHGVTIDPQTREVYVNDRGNRRIQIFDENGTFKRMWSIEAPANIHFVYIGQDRQLTVFNNSTQHLAKFDPGRPPDYAVGRLGRLSRALCGARTASAWTRKAICTWPRSAMPSRKNSGRGPAPTRTSWSASPFTRPGNNRLARAVRAGAIQIASEEAAPATVRLLFRERRRLNWARRSSFC